MFMINLPCIPFQIHLKRDMPPQEIQMPPSTCSEPGGKQWQHHIQHTELRIYWWWFVYQKMNYSKANVSLHLNYEQNKCNGLQNQFILVQFWHAILCLWTRQLSTRSRSMMWVFVYKSLNQRAQSVMNIRRMLPLEFPPEKFAVLGETVSLLKIEKKANI